MPHAEDLPTTDFPFKQFHYVSRTNILLGKKNSIT